MVRRWKLTLDWLYLADDSNLPKRLAEKIEAAKVLRVESKKEP